jgi:hypothetical protein
MHKLLKYCVAATVLIAAGGASCVAQERAAGPGKAVILHAARLLDVKTGAILSDQVIVIEGSFGACVATGFLVATLCSEECHSERTKIASFIHRHYETRSHA